MLKDFPPKPGKKHKSVPPGIAALVWQALGLTWCALAQAAGIPNQATVRDIGLGGDVKLSNLQAVAAALRLDLELVDE